MKKIHVISFVALLTFCNFANAFFFFWFPSSGGGTTDPNMKCAGENVTVGQNIAVDGKQYVIKVVEGTSSKCTSSLLPNLVRVELIGDVQQRQSSAKLELDAGWDQKPLTDVMKTGGGVLYAVNRTIDSGLLISTTDKKPITNIETFINTKRNTNVGGLQEVTATEIVKSQVNGLNSWQYQKVGKSKSGTSFTYFYTWVESVDEIVLINLWTTTNNFANASPTFIKVVNSLSGLPATFNVQPVAPVPIAAETKSNPNDTTSKLQLLKDLFDKGLITKDDYDKKRQSLLNGM